jgi:hypothetical protein
LFEILLSDALLCIGHWNGGVNFDHGHHCWIVLVDFLFWKANK